MSFLPSYCFASINMMSMVFPCSSAIIIDIIRLILDLFDHVSHYMRDVFHWLPYPQRISYRIASLVWRCLSGWAPSYLRELCRPLLTVIWWSHLPALRQCKPVHFLWLVQKPGMDFQQI